MLKKLPAVNTLPIPSGAMAQMSRSGLGAHALSAAPAPVVASLARLLRGCPPMNVKAPPAYRSAPSNVRCVGMPSGPGFHTGSAAPDPPALSLARYRRDCPPIFVNQPDT